MFLYDPHRVENRVAPVCIAANNFKNLVEQKPKLVNIYLYLSIYTHECMYVYVCTCTHTYIQVHTGVHRCVYVCIHVCMWSFKCMYCMYTYMTYIHDLRTLSKIQKLKNQENGKKLLSLKNSLYRYMGTHMYPGTGNSVYTEGRLSMVGGCWQNTRIIYVKVKEKYVQILSSRTE